jgi:hypothetical protein
MIMKNKYSYHYGSLTIHAKLSQRLAKIYPGNLREAIWYNGELHENYEKYNSMVTHIHD